MKRLGKQIDARLVEVVVIPRPDDEFVFEARPVLSEEYKIFDKLCPQPQPAMVVRPGNPTPVPKLDDSAYDAAFVKWGSLKTDYMFLVSLSATEWLEWETVKTDDPETWSNVRAELLDAGFAENEVLAIFKAAISANGLDDKKIEVATKNFLAGRAVQSN